MNRDDALCPHCGSTDFEINPPLCLRWDASGEHGPPRFLRIDTEDIEVTCADCQNCVLDRSVVSTMTQIAASFNAQWGASSPLEPTN
ncbi:hypothetical protein [Embleya hyalina]|uniref:Uncharacterized protein n=1 Tax=Embleya hyalina TaxID=516124 RepID=A0A401YZ27_9ACTN|nr:hypothetical protein [Embleya hyalina]GCD99879.1 hypothetical protein EHYA_07601 [Embleya hyalina]